MIPPNGTLITVWEWFILGMVLYNLFSATYIISFVEPNMGKCGDSSPIAPILTILSQACQSEDRYDDAAAHPAGNPDALEGTPLQYAVQLPCASSIFTVCNYLSDMAFFVDIVLNFLTGYIPRRSSVPEYDLKRIAMNYIQDTFVIDAVATFPWEVVLKLFFPSTKEWLGLKMINLVRFIRLIKVQRKLGNYLSSPFVHFGYLIGVYLLCAHCLGCVLFYMGRWQLWLVDGVASVNDFLGDPWIVKECIQFADSTTQYSVSLYWSITTITTVGYGDIVPNTNTDKMVVMMAMFCSGVLQAVILANVALIIDGIQSKRAHVNERVKQVTAALTFHDIPAALIRRVVDSIEYYASQHYGSQDREIMEVFPERLRTDIATAVLGEVYPAIGIFLGCSRSMARQLAMHWAMMIVPPNEHVIVTGAPVIEMFHLVQGVCVARTTSGLHIDTLSEGSALGHLDAVLGTTCGADILAKTYCTMYCLSVTDMLEVFESFPEEATRIRARAQEERNRSRDATVAKLLRYRTAMRSNHCSQSILQSSAAQALAEEEDGMSEGLPHMQDSNPTITGRLSHSQETISGRDMVILEPSTVGDDRHESDSRSVIPDYPSDAISWNAPSTSGGYRNVPQQSVLSQAMQKAQGMILSLQDTMTTLEALAQKQD